jgi:hypothetical protein
MFLFGGKPIRGLGGFRAGLRGTCDRAGIPYGKKAKNGITMHDFRRTVKTNMLKAGV